MRFAGASHTIRTLHPTTDIQISKIYPCWMMMHPENYSLSEFEPIEGGLSGWTNFGSHHHVQKFTWRFLFWILVHQ
ncbi:hypothetical protein RIR_jg29528.t1 [Rhizophagus irregularis DAOM 181602=DAOM 197198]|nr:hypothetical protein RIR_jg29528.t1 [Rhizophagus irregularis DAOM 181602=DAOM 197198]